MENQVPVLIGTAGMVEGECFLLDQGVDLIIGRSRSCDISLRRTTAYLKTPPAARDSDHDFNTVSRRHLRILVTDASAALQDLSTNGTFYNGDALKDLLTIDLTAGACTIRLGTRETFQLCMLERSDPRLKDIQPVSVVSAAAKAEGQGTD